MTAGERQPLTADELASVDEWLGWFGGEASRPGDRGYIAHLTRRRIADAEARVVTAEAALERTKRQLIGRTMQMHEYRQENEFMKRERARLQQTRAGSSPAAEAELDAHDLRFDIFRSGAGQQAYPNVKASAVKITHIPTGLSSECSEHTSQLRNKEQALAELRAKVAASGVSDTREGDAPTSSLEEGLARAAGYLRANAASPVPAVADDPACVCAMTSTRNCPVHGQGDAVANDPRSLAQADADYVHRWLQQTGAPGNILDLQMRVLSTLAGPGSRDTKEPGT